MKGIPLGEIVEIDGREDTGKTQLWYASKQFLLMQSSIQLALSVQIPRVLSGNQGETMYFLFSYYDH